MRFIGSENKKGRAWRCIGLLMLSLLSCSGGQQHNDHPLLASNWGGTAGGPIAGRLEVQVFDDTTLFPYPGAIVALGASGTRTAKTDNQGIALFTGVSGPQDIHVFACAGCDADPNDPTTPLLYQIASLYQVNASQVSIPLVPRDPQIANGTVQGKVFDVARDETSYVASIDELGRFQVDGPLGSGTYQILNDESPSPADLMFVSTRDLDDWAAADSGGGKQGFGTVALVGRAINGSKQPQAGVHVTARYFQGIDAGRAYYFNETGKIDPGLNATTSDGRFLFLRLAPKNDLLIAADSLGVGVGARYLHLNAGGTTVFTLPVLPLVQQNVDLSGRVVSYRLDFREEERKGPLSSQNAGVEAAVINFSGDTLDQSLIADSGPAIAGDYRSQQHLIANGRYVVVILASRDFRPTYQELNLRDRSKFNYPLATVPVTNLVAMVRAKKGSDTSGLTLDTAEILGRITAPTQTGEVDANGDAITTPVENAKITIVDESGKEISTLAYFDANGAVDPNLNQTSTTGGFLAFDLTQGVYTVIATDTTTGATIGRKTLPVYANSVHLLELVNKPGEIITGSAQGNINQNLPLLFGLLGGGSPDCLQTGKLGPDCTLPAAGEYVVESAQRSGGGDYTIPVIGPKRMFGLSAFRVSPDHTLNNVTFAGGLGPLSAGGTLNDDISFLPEPGLVPTEGTIRLPSNFTMQDVRAVLIGSIGDRGGTFVGADATVFFGKTDPTFRALSLPAQGALSYFMLAFAQNSKGEGSLVYLHDLPEIPSRQDLALDDPPRPLAPAPNQEVAVDSAQPHLVWAPPDAGPIDFYRVILQTLDGQLLWEAWIPGNQNEITLPAFPEGGPTQLNPFLDGQTVVWQVNAIRAGGLSLQEFTFRQLAQRRISSTIAQSRFIPRRTPQ